MSSLTARPTKKAKTSAAPAAGHPAVSSRELVRLAQEERNRAQAAVRNEEDLDAAKTLIGISGRKAGPHDTSATILKDAVNSVGGRKKGKKKPGRKRKKKEKVCFEPNIARAAMFIGDEIPDDLDVKSINRLLGECLLYESLFIWQAQVTEEYKTICPSEPSDVLGYLFYPLRSYHKPIVNLLLELPRLRGLRYYDDVLKSGDVANLALEEAQVIILHDMFTSQQFESTDDIAAYYEEHIKTRFIPKGDFVQPIISTIGECFNFVSVEDDNLLHENLLHPSWINRYFLYFERFEGTSTSAKKTIQVEETADVTGDTSTHKL